MKCKRAAKGPGYGAWQECHVIISTTLGVALPASKDNTLFLLGTNCGCTPIPPWLTGVSVPLVHSYNVKKKIQHPQHVTTGPKLCCGQGEKIRAVGLEPTTAETPGPKPGVSTNFTMPAPAGPFPNLPGFPALLTGEGGFEPPIPLQVCRYESKG